MHKKQIENLLNLSSEERFEYFVRYSADFEEVWGIVVGEDNWVIFKDDEEREIFPIWSHKDLAEKCCFIEHKEMGATPQSIPMDIFIDECIDDMKEHNVFFGVFYNIEREGQLVSPQTLKKILKAEVESLWG